MKKTVIAPILFLAVFFSFMVPDVFSQATPASKLIRVRKIKMQKQRTPEYEVKRVQMTTGKIRNWMQIQVAFDTAPEWMDQIDFTYYAVVKSKKGKEKYTLFRNSLSYVNIEKGSHESVMYLHPSTLERYGDVERVAVILRVNGQVAAIESDPPSSQRWWEQLPPLDGYLLNRLETPFALINYDNYPAIKSSGNNR